MRMQATFLADAVATLSDGKVVDVDLGLAGSAAFTNHVGVGLSADLMAAAPRLLKRLIGRTAYPVTALGLLVRHRALRVVVRADGREHTFLTHQLYVANGGFHAGRPIAADAHADDRLLVAYPVGGSGRWGLLRETARNVATGHRRTLGEEPFLAAGELWVETDRPARVEVDLLADGDDLVISVANTGNGIPPNRLAGIFSDGVSSHGPERGLGLSIVRSTAESLGGTVEITHPGGAGALTVFVARLPQVLRPPVEVTA